MSPVRQTSSAESYRIAAPLPQLSRGEMRHRPQGRRPFQPIRPRGFPSHAASYRHKPDVALVAAAWNPGSARTRQLKDGLGRSVLVSAGHVCNCCAAPPKSVCTTRPKIRCELFVRQPEERGPGAAPHPSPNP